MPVGTLFLIPAPLGPADPIGCLPVAVQARMRGIEYFIAENPKSARGLLKALGHPKPLAALRIETLDARTPADRIGALLEPIAAGADAGLVSEAGAPAVADPGALLVRGAHDAGIPVVPLVGPSAILLALMASGLEGQRFAFHGYLPVAEPALRQALKQFEQTSRKLSQTQIFIETPYRNDRLLRLIATCCADNTLLCVATNLTQPDETIRTTSIAAWRKHSGEIGKRPSVFLLLGQ